MWLLITAYRQEWVEKMLQLQPRLPVWNETTGKPEWPNLLVGEVPLIHGSHDEAILYANEGTVLHGFKRMATI